MFSENVTVVSLNLQGVPSEDGSTPLVVALRQPNGNTFPITVTEADASKFLIGAEVPHTVGS